MKKIAIIIVNYNVRYFLEHCLLSVEKAIDGLEAEVWVVDNNSSDDSLQIVKEKFSYVNIISNNFNAGFSKANNQAAFKSEAEYLLFLNPDTIVGENTFKICVDYFDNNPEVGGIGVKMIDGKGVFLPESKRGLPSPLVSFYKIIGLSSLFPLSTTFGRYHLGFLDKNKNHEIEIMSGACMAIRNSIVKKAGCFDELFFMYGEDIDLSYRIIKEGYKNAYLSDTSIIHYKGESTKKTSLNYVYVFYNAMIIFAQKHFLKSKSFLFSFIIKTAIFLRAGLDVIIQICSKLVIPIADFIFIFTGYYFIKHLWEDNVKAHNVYPPQYMLVVVPVYIFIWLFSAYLNGAYSRPYNVFRILRGVFLGTLLISALSNFLDVARFSKSLIVLGGMLSGIIILINRFLLHYIQHQSIHFHLGKQRRCLVIGSEDEFCKIKQIIQSSGNEAEVVGFIADKTYSHPDYLGNTENGKNILSLLSITEIVWGTSTNSFEYIIKSFEEYSNQDVDLKILPLNCDYVIGSSSKNKNGTVYTAEMNLNILEELNLRNKRVIDLLLSFTFIISSPIWIIFSSKKEIIFDLLKVLIGEKTFISIQNVTFISGKWKKRTGIYLPWKESNEQINHKQFQIYTKEYRAIHDFTIILQGIKSILFK